MEVAGMSFGIFHVAAHCVNLAKRLRLVRDDKFDELYWRLQTEQAKTVQCVSKLVSLKYSPPRGEEKQFRDLILGLKVRFNELEADLEKLNPRETTYKDTDVSRDLAAHLDMGIRMRTLTRRLLFDYGRFDQLAQTLNTIQAMNKHLENLLPSAYSATSFASKQFPGLKSDHAISACIDAKDFSIQDSTTATAASTQLNRNSSAHNPVELGSTSSLEETAIPCLPIYRLGIVGLRKIHKALQNLTSTVEATTALSDCLSQLELWGAGVFQESKTMFDPDLDLDRLWLAPAGQRHQSLHMFVIKTLINILVLEFFILESILPSLQESSVSDQQCQDLLKLKSQILLTMADENFTEQVKQRFEEIFPSWHDSGFDLDFDDSESESDDEDDSKRLPAHFSDIQISVEGLYAVLPSISACRHSHALDLAAKRAVTSRSNTAAASTISDTVPLITTPSCTDSPGSFSCPIPSTASTTPATSVDFLQHESIIQSNLGLAKTLAGIFKDEERYFRRNRAPVREFAPELEKEVERLEGYYSSLGLAYNGPGKAGSLNASTPNLLSSGEVQAGLMQNKAGQRIMEFIFQSNEPMNKLGVGGDVKGPTVEEKIEEVLEGMVSEFTLKGVTGLAERRKEISGGGA